MKWAISGLLWPVFLFAQVELRNGQASGFQEPLQWEADYSGGWRPIAVPGYWVHDPGLPPTGQLNYRLRFKLKETFPYDAIEATEIHAASVIRLNGIVICRTGKPGISRITEKSRIYPLICILPPGVLQTENELHVEVTNYHTRSGGILSLKIGRLDALEREQRLAHLEQGLYMGVIGLAGFIFFIYYFSRKEVAHLLFSLACLLINLRVFSSSSYLELYFVDRDVTDLRFFLEYATAVSLLPLTFSWYFHFLLRPETYLGVVLSLLHRSCLYLISLGSVSIFAFLLFSADASIYGRYQPLMVRGLLLPCALFLLLLQIALALRGNSDARLTLIGYLLLALAVFHDGVITIRGAAGPFYVPAGMLALIASLCFVMGRSLRRMTEKIRQSHEELQKAHARLTEQDRYREQFLQEAARELRGGLGRMNETLQNLFVKIPAAQHKPFLQALDPLQGWMKDADLVIQDSGHPPEGQEKLPLLLERLAAELSPDGIDLSYDARDTSLLPASLRAVLFQIIHVCQRQWLCSQFQFTYSSDAVVRVQAQNPGAPPHLRALQRILLERLTDRQGWIFSWLADGFQIVLPQTDRFQKRHIAFLREIGRTRQADREERTSSAGR
ncbi:MAG: 7TM-DISM domain-containing protein [Spirochaetales bacterium]|nr:7TM-DISM domain-containing protein [Spirochaetales bacterium]